MKFKTILLTLVLGFILYSQPKPDQDQVLATVGDEIITFGSYLSRYEDYLIWSGLQDNKQARFSILNNMVNEIILKKFDDNSAVYNNPEFKKEIRWANKEAILAFLKDREIYAKINATEEELRTAYARSKTKIEVRHLYASTEKEAQNLYRLAKMGVSFNELAKQCFTDTVLRNNGGYLGYINWGEADLNFENTAYSLKVGDISEPVKTAQGFSIIKVESFIQNPLKTEDEFLRMKNKLERAVRISKKIPYEEEYLNKFFDKSNVIFNDPALNTILEDLNKSNYTTIEIESHNRGKAEKECVKLKDKIFSIKDIESKLLNVPQYNLTLITNLSKLKHAVLGLVMQDALFEIAKQKGYDTSSYVNESFNTLSNNIYLGYKKEEIFKLIPVSDSDIEKYYRDNIEFYSKEREINVQEIIVNNDSLAFEIKKKIESGENFGSLAEAYSIRTWSAKNKGEMGFIPVSSLGDMQDSLWNLKSDRILGPVKFDKYYGLFHVITKKESIPIELSLVKPQIIKAIRNEKGFSYMKQYIENLSRKTTIKINDALVKNYSMRLDG